MIKDYEGSLYGNFRQVSFTDVYSSAKDFLKEYKSIGIPTTIQDTMATT